MIVVVLILLLYYLVFVRSDIRLPQTVASKKKIEPFDYFVGGSTIAVKNQSRWNVPALPEKFTWTQDRKIRKTNPCVGGKDLVPATGKDVYRYFENDLSVYKGVGYKGQNESFEGYVTDVKYIYYFQCKNDEIDKLLYCPENTVFEESECVPFNLCRSMPDGYAYENPDNETFYFRCENQLPRAVKCPDEHVFVSGRCARPSDPCVFHPDFHIYEHDEKGYKHCVGGASKTVLCLKDEYFHPDLQKCVPDACKNQRDGDVLEWRDFRGKLNYVAAYKRCKDGVLVESVDCTKLPADPLDVRLPVQGLVYEGRECRQPKWCVNVHPLQPDVTVPGTRFRDKIVNYVGTVYLDAFYGYRCENGQPVYRELEHNQVINSKLDVVQLNDSGNSPNFRDKTFRSYYNVDTGRVEQCPADHFYDLMARRCVPDIPNAWTLSFDWDAQTKVDLQVFSFKNLDPLDNWYMIREVLQDDPVECEDGQVRIRHYNVCSHPDCIKYPFLKQLDDRVIYIDDEYECAMRDGQLVRREHKREGKLNFWKQSFGTRVEDCTLGQKLESGDFTMDSSVYVTCNLNTPFAFCPSQAIDHVSEDGVCFFRQEFLNIVVEPGRPVTLHKDCIWAIHSFKAIFVIDGTDRFVLNKNEVYPGDLGVDTSRYFTIESNKEMVIDRRRIPTNHPERFINRSFALYRKFIFGQTGTSYSEIQMEEYPYARSIAGYY